MQSVQRIWAIILGFSPLTKHRVGLQTESQKLISAGKTIFENIDSRPESRFRIAAIAHNELLHPVLALNLNKRALDADAEGVLSVAAAQQNADQMHLRRITDNKIGVPSRRAKAMAALCDFTGDSDRGAKSIR